jgi:hypothetical protein
MQSVITLAEDGRSAKVRQRMVQQMTLGSRASRPSPDLLSWHAPPTTRIAMLPIVYEIPYHYANPVTGRAALPRLPSIDEQLREFPLPTQTRVARP